ncbi:MAG: hypothetical protein MAG458_00758 [Nitrosopumilus sp.]|nr:hypothetical protein [Nitrosopumilus sp.]
MVSPISADEDGIKFKPEKMEKEKLYHCIFKNKAMLGFKDSQDVLNCYEVEDMELVQKIKQCTTSDELEEFFDDYLKSQNLKN